MSKFKVGDVLIDHSDGEIIKIIEVHKTWYEFYSNRRNRTQNSRDLIEKLFVKLTKLERLLYA